MFTLFAPLSSAGEIAIGERRMNWSRPSKSAVLGIVAAALGIKQTQDQEHRKLHSQFNYAVETIQFGRSMLDYQTAQVPIHESARTFATRFEEISVDVSKLHTVLSSREWRTDSFYIAVLWVNGVASWTIESIQKALCNPMFTVYLGRKAAPFGLPLDPCVVDAGTLLEALERKKFTPMELEILENLGNRELRNVAFDIGASGVPTDDVRVERRRDSLLSRSRWHFDERDEGVCDLSPRIFRNDDANVLE